MSNVERYYITTPIYYVNAKPHLGHAYTTIVADSMARFQRAMGREVRFLTGTDEHGDKIAQAAETAGTTPQAYADEISGLFRDLWPTLKVTNSDFIRTTEQRHKRVVQAILQRVYDAGDIYHGHYEGHYCYGCERFLTEKELEGGKCPDHQTSPELIREKNYFFRMSKYQGWLAEHIRANPGFIRPERYEKEVLAILDSGALEDLCISRPKARLKWGIELPFDTDYVCYVWFDALLNYVSALDWPDGEDFAKFWPVAEHLVAKDILKPHAIFWPTMLKAAGLPVYQHLNVHGYWLIKDTKMSKSLGNVVAPLDMAEKYGLDAFRYFLLREMRFGSDASFSEEALVGRFNADLANDLGNLFNRTLNMCGKYFGSKAPTAALDSPQAAEARELADDATANFRTLFGECRFARGLEALWELVRWGNKFVDEQAPWALAKEGRDAELAEVMSVLLAVLRSVAAHLLPVMPDKAAAMLEQLGQPVTADLAAEIGRFEAPAAGTELAARSNLFPRIDVKALAAEAEAAPKVAPKLKKASKAAPQDGAEADLVSIEEVRKLDLRIGKVLAAEKHPKADKLLKLMIDVGEDAPRQIIAGLADFYVPDELVGRAVTVVVNLKPAKLRGLESQGMVLAVKTEGGMLLLTPNGGAPAGAQVS